MSEIIINVNDYLSKEEIKNIIISELTSQIRDTIRAQKADNLISNVGYEIVKNIISAEIENYDNLIKEKVIEIINKLSSYSVFNDGSYNDKKSKGYLLMEKAVEENYPILKEKIKNILSLEDGDRTYEIGVIVEKFLAQKLG